MRKWKSSKSVKNRQKCQKPVLRPKMQKTGVHAVWQKCPHQMARKTRKVTFTPLSDIPPLFWPFSCFDHIFWFCILSLFSFWWFSLFCILPLFLIFSILLILWFAHFLTPFCNKALIVLWKATFLVHRGDRELSCGGSPLFQRGCFFILSFCVFLFSCRGDYTG